MNTTEHLLTCLSEECIEVAKNVSKALRFGLDVRNIEQPQAPVNWEQIVQELNDLAAVLDLCVLHEIFPKDLWDSKAQDAKRAKIIHFMEYARQVGALSNPQ